MKPTRLLLPALALALLAGSGSAFAQNYGRQYYDSQNYGAQSYYGQPPVNRWQSDRDAFQQRGFQDGMVGADRDFQNHRRPDVNNRDEFRNPRFIPGWAQRDYREGFRRGYYQRVHQIYGDRYR